ncbi:unnamed protein product [Kuraishia capsulata CBS 1993]|uniref:Eukaryotic translation initiation factor 2A n=1 Tax=Kuraishia capsulata CBS 1993 TaxID=1382522 RepID=W6MRT8_9ASCO|nr:uncharacterized protein KUCA_T00005065001 [Kuraishia capsulata CBS 1993]CDK29078.1 unnamed protein product [Kuraishia capsulata CBS 1993]
MATTQFYCRQPKSIELINGQPQFDSKFETTTEKPDCKASQYSPSGKIFAFSEPQSVVLVDVNTGAIVKKIEVQDVFDLLFSPLGSYLCTWSKPIKNEFGNWNDNVKIWRIPKEDPTDVKLITEYSSKNQTGWSPQFTGEETLMTKVLNQSEIGFYKLGADTIKLDKPVDTLSVKEIGKIQSFNVSPGKNPSVAIFIPEQKGQPASIRVYSVTNFKKPVSQKQFFKGERCQFTWNALGTSLLALVSTDVDSSNKSYYGETTLYLLGIAGSFDQRITLNKEGPIHDLAWSPTGREFGVVYGYMPAKTTFFDSRGDSIFSFPEDSRNTILFSPHAKYVLVAGFGNLQGTVDIYDRQDKFAKITSFQASNTSVCKWSPDGRYILTATTSPRLRVDNGVKIWHASGKLCYVKEHTELVSVNWLPQDLALFPGIKKTEIACEPHQSAVEYLAKRNKSSGNASGVAKPSGAYRPPHARNSAAPAQSTTLWQKEKLMNDASQPQPMTSSQLASQPRQKVIPGAKPVLPPGLPIESKAALKNRKKRLAKKEKESTASPEVESAPEVPQLDTLVIGGVSSLEDKKIRSLLKKLRAIEQLKAKQIDGEHLEDTQVLKIETEPKVRAELTSLGWSE